MTNENFLTTPTSLKSRADDATHSMKRLPPPRRCEYYIYRFVSLTFATRRPPCMSLDSDGDRRSTYSSSSSADNNTSRWRFDIRFNGASEQRGNSRLSDDVKLIKTDCGNRTNQTIVSRLIFRIQSSSGALRLRLARSRPLLRSQLALSGRASDAAERWGRPWLRSACPPHAPIGPLPQLRRFAGSDSGGPGRSAAPRPEGHSQICRWAAPAAGHHLDGRGAGLHASVFINTAGLSRDSSRYLHRVGTAL
jgi:hypothetical protein